MVDLDRFVRDAVLEDIAPASGHAAHVAVSQRCGECTCAEQRAAAPTADTLETCLAITVARRIVTSSLAVMDRPGVGVTRLLRGSGGRGHARRLWDLPISGTAGQRVR
jgi:hypothetical protein